MKDLLKTFIISGLLFGIVIGTIVTIISNVWSGIVIGIILGTLFGLVISLFVFLQSKNFKKDLKSFKDKNLIYDSGANHIVRLESVGGWLYLTDNELIFKSHNFNINNHTYSIPLNKIKDVKPFLTLGIIPNGIKVITYDSVDKFVVYQRKEWIKHIMQYKK